jgi:hypothetical protein
VGGNDDGDVGHAKDKDRTSQEETCKAEEDVAELARQRVAAEKTVADVDAVVEAGPARTKEAIVTEVATAEVIAPRTTTDETAAEEATAAEAPSDQAGQRDPYKTVEEVTEETLVGVGTLGPQETVV